MFRPVHVFGSIYSFKVYHAEAGRVKDMKREKCSINFQPQNCKRFMNDENVPLKIKWTVYFGEEMLWEFIFEAIVLDLFQD